MPKRRLPYELWQEVRRRVWQRDGGLCQGPYCRDRPPLPLDGCHIDHLRSGKLAGNELTNLRVLCPACHALRLDPRHRGLIGKALQKGLIPPDWRRFTWDKGHFWPEEETIDEFIKWRK